MKKILNSLFRKNLPIKITALFLSLLLYSLVRLSQNYSVETLIQVKYTNLPPNLALIDSPPDSISVILTGNGYNFVKLEHNKPFYISNLETFEKGRNLLAFEKDNITIPGDISITCDKILTNKYFTINTDYKSKKLILLKPVYDDNMPEGYFLESKIQLNPKKVLAYGPRGYIKQIRQIETDKIDLAKFINEGLDSIDIAFPDKIFAEKTKTGVSFDYSYITDIKLNIPLEYNKKGSNTFSSSTNSVKITISGKNTIVDIIDETDFKAIINIPSEAGSHMLTPELKFGIKGIEISSMEPGRVEVEVSE